MRLLGTTVVASALILSLIAAAASPALAELQVDLGVTMPPSGSRRVLQSIPPGEATMKAALRNRRGETVQVDLDFDYRIRSGIVFDEIIDRIEIMVETVNGVPFSSPTIIEPGTINLNPNRARLAYRATLYRPAGPEGYVVRIRVFGNYE